MKKKQMRKRKGFTLIELVIVVAIIGILALMILPQFNNVTNDAKVKTFESNCQTVTSAIAMYQAGNNGKYPSKESDLDAYINGGWASLKDKPAGATYTYTGAASSGASGQFEASFTDDKGEKHTFSYPSKS